MNVSLHKMSSVLVVRRMNQTDELIQANQSDGNVQKNPLIKCPRTLGIL